MGAGNRVHPQPWTRKSDEPGLWSIQRVQSGVAGDGAGDTDAVKVCGPSRRRGYKTAQKRTREHRLNLNGAPGQRLWVGAPGETTQGN